jgi:hypothetical protein
MTARRLLQRHDTLLERLDAWLGRLQARHGDQMRCTRGCARCRHGLFDVSLPDALRIAEAFGMLPGEVRSAITNRASAIQKRIGQEGAELRAPFFLNAISQDRVDQIVDRIPGVRCPLLDGATAVSSMAAGLSPARLEGAPMVDSHNGLFGDWCELNFKGGVSEESAQDLRLDYYEIREIEQQVTKDLSHYLPANSREEATLFIPSIIAEFGRFWKFHLNAEAPATKAAPRPCP